MGVAISLAGLASAVANEGGIGIISAAGIGMREPDYIKHFTLANNRGLRKEIRKARSLSDGIIGVNIMMALSDHEDLIKASIEEQVDLIILGAGLPLGIPGVIAKAGLGNNKTKLVIKVSSAKAARLIMQHWLNKFNCLPDAVVVEGPLAGGHLGFKKEEVVNPTKTLYTLIEETVKEVAIFEAASNKEIPVIAAGGIYTGKDMYDILKAGAKGVKIGTRLVPTFECDASLAFKETYIKSEDEDITIIDSPVGLPGRVIRNNFVAQITAGETKPVYCPWKCLSSCNYKEVPYCIALALYNAAIGNMEEGFAFSGAKAYMTDKIRHVSEVLESLMSEYEQAVFSNQLLCSEKEKLTCVFRKSA
jgi:nitronate monooxygenase